MLPSSVENREYEVMNFFIDSFHMCISLHLPPSREQHSWLYPKKIRYNVPHLSWHKFPVYLRSGRNSEDIIYSDMYLVCHLYTAYITTTKGIFCYFINIS